MKLSSAALTLLVCGAPAVLAVTGTVTDADGQPLEQARVCYFQAETNVEQGCTNPSDTGIFQLPDSRHMLIRVSAEGYFPETVPALGHQTVVLKLSPTLTVRLVDDSNGEPIATGEVFVIYSSATMKGPFPTNPAGVKISRVLKSGDVRLIGKADGYDESKPHALTLEPGVESEVSLRLRPKSEAKKAD
jgi:hypothetical protein